MKKNLLLILTLVSLLSWTNSALAAERELLHYKFGLNSTGLEIEKIFDSGIGLHLSETIYRRHDRWNTINNLKGESSIAYTTLAGLRKYTRILGQDLYLGGSAGLSGLDPTLNGHVGYEFQLTSGSQPVFLRAEGGWSLIFEVTQDQGIESCFQFGFGIGSLFDLDFSGIYY